MKKIIFFHIGINIVLIYRLQGFYLKFSNANLFNFGDDKIKIFYILCNSLFFFQFLNYFIVVKLQLSAFSPYLSTPLQPNPPPSPASTLPLGFVHMSFIVVPENPSPR